LYRMGRATEADVQKLLPSLSEYEIASQFGRTDTGGYRSRDIDAPSRDRLREFIEIQKPTIDANRPDMFPYDPRGPKAQGRVLEMSNGGDVSGNRFAQMVEEEQRTQDQLLENINRQMSELISRYRSGDSTVTEKDLLPFFPGYNEYDIAQMYGTTTEATSPRMSEKINPFTVDMIPNVKRRGEAVESDFDRMVREGKLLDPMMPKRVMELSKGGEIANDDFIQEMLTGTRPEDFPETSSVDKKAGELLRALSEGTRGFVGAEPIEAGSEAYRTGQALANMPAVGVVAATAKGAGKSAKEITDFIKNAEGSPLVVYRGLMLGENTSSGALKGKGREGYASFGSSSPYVAASYGTPSADEAEKLAGTITPLLIKASKVVEFPVTTNRYGSRQFDKFEFDRRAQSLKPGEVLVARDVVDIGPRASTSVDPEKLYSYGSDIYAWGPETETVSAITKKAKGAGKSVGQAKALMERMTPELEKFLKDSVVKERLYRGQRRAPAEEGFALTQGRGTPSFTTDTEVANVYSRQLGFGNPEYGPGSTVVPAYVQMKNPLDIRDLGEYIDLESFVNRLPNVDLNKPTVKNGFGYEDIAKMVRGIGSVASKTGAKYEIEASSPGSIFRVTEFDELADAIEELGEAGKSEKIQEMLFDTSIDAFLIGDSKNVKNALKEKGFDGVIHKDAFDVGGQYYQGDPKNLEGGTYAEYIHDSYRPFFQEKIKSAVGNVGTYDTTKKAITKAKGGEVTNDEFIQEMMVGTRPTDQEAFVERTSDVLSKTPKSQELANQIRNLFQSLETPSPSAQEEYLERRPTPESREPIRSRKAMEAFLKAANPRLEIEERPLPGGRFGFVRADDPDTLVISTRQFPAQREETAFHELEHSLSERGGNPLGKLSKEGKPIVMDNNYRFDVLYNQDKKIGGEGRFARFDMMNRFIKNKDKLEKFFGRPFDSNYFSREPESGLFAEQIADLSALEQVTNKSLTRDPEMRKLLFPDDKSAAVYDAITGLRQTRLDAKDLSPYTPNYPEEKSMMDWIRGKLGMDKK